MRAALYHSYGAPSVVELTSVDKPVPKDDEVLIAVRAASVNPADWHFMRGTPYLVRLFTGLRKPKDIRLGIDVAGEVEAVGRNVTQFKPGDHVFGSSRGSFAEYAVSNESKLARKPDSVTFEQAGSVTVAAMTALQALRDKGRLRSGQNVLINGAAGGVGTFAVQIAKAFGAEVTGVCSTRNVDMVRSIGADRVIDYTKEDFTRRSERYDVFLDCIGNHSLSVSRRIVNPRGAYVMAGAATLGNWIDPLLRPLHALVSSPFVSQRLVGVFAQSKKDDLNLMSELMAARKVTPVIDRRYALSNVAEAIAYLEEGHARGKVVIAPMNGTS